MSETSSLETLGGGATPTRGIDADLGGARPLAGPEQLRALAAQFESLLLSHMLQQMRQSMFDDGDEEASGFGSGPLADSLFTELSIALSRAGGFGLGQSLLGPLMEAAGTPGVGTPNVGTPGLPTPGLPRPGLLRPGVAERTSGFGWREDPISGVLKFHKGLDLAMAVGQEVPAARDGEVVSAGELPGYGLTVLVKHSETTSTRYAHLSEILVRAGEAVAAGQTIARSGATGRVTGPHLHFEVLQHGRPVDPSGRW
jgi:murein DD-endopeptidase MepM/ murein hydrolase activator NlpD